MRSKSECCRCDRTANCRDVTNATVLKNLIVEIRFASFGGWIGICRVALLLVQTLKRVRFIGDVIYWRIKKSPIGVFRRVFRNWLLSSEINQYGHRYEQISWANSGRWHLSKLPDITTWGKSIFVQLIKRFVAHFCSKNFIFMELFTHIKNYTHKFASSKFEWKVRTSNMDRQFHLKWCVWMKRSHKTVTWNGHMKQW